MDVFGGGKYEKYFKYIVTYNLSSFYCDRNGDYSNGSVNTKSCLCSYDFADYWNIRHN